MRILPLLRPVGTQAGESGSTEQPDSRHPIADLEYQITEKRKFGSFSCQGGATLVCHHVSQYDVLLPLCYGVKLIRFHEPWFQCVHYASCFESFVLANNLGVTFELGLFIRQTVDLMRQEPIALLISFTLRHAGREPV